MNRSVQVEGAFGVLKNDYEFQKFLLRGKTKVKLEILLLCMGYNINKLHAKIQKRAHRKLSFPSKRNSVNSLKNGGLFKVRQKSGRSSKRKRISSGFFYI